MPFEKFFNNIEDLPDPQDALDKTNKMVEDSREWHKEHYKKFITEPTFEETEAFEKAKIFTKNLLREFRGDPEKVDHIEIHTLLPDAMEILEEDYEGAIADSLGQLILYERNEEFGEMDIINTIIHELWHLVTYRTVLLSFNEEASEQEVLPDRQGLIQNVVSKDDVVSLFGRLEEAVIAELQNRAHKYFFHQKPLTETRKKECMELDNLVKKLYTFELGEQESKISYDKFKQEFIYQLIKAQVNGDLESIIPRVDSLALNIAGEEDGWKSIGQYMSN